MLTYYQKLFDGKIFIKYDLKYFAGKLHRERSKNVNAKHLQISFQNGVFCSNDVNGSQRSNQEVLKLILFD